MMMKSTLPELSKSLIKWYEGNQRPLPWRINRDPYRIWISEVMLQQTTVQAVVPYYERFLLRFPTLSDLAKAPETQVLELWSGLGYYSRARNLHKSALLLEKRGFPKTAVELMHLPGFGPYTSRAVTSLAFGEMVGVLDGNVIRVLCRVFGLSICWWKVSNRNQLQEISDSLAQNGSSEYLNQGLMELGALVCTPQSPNCTLCPWMKNCKALSQNIISKLPLKKPRKQSEVWVWQPIILKKRNKIALVYNDYAPFLRGQLIPPGWAHKKKLKPKKFDDRHSITHHDIYIKLAKSKIIKMDDKKIHWVEQEHISQASPSSLIKKVLQIKSKQKGNRI